MEKRLPNPATFPLALAWANDNQHLGSPNNFRISNSFGKVGEWARLHHMQALNFEMEKGPTEGYEPRHDLVLRRGSSTHREEVKTDFWTASTRNLFIEASEHGKWGQPGAVPSGVFKTEADLYVLFSPAEGLFYVAEA